jgi:DnaJ-class molecular chaperone
MVIHPVASFIASCKEKLMPPKFKDYYDILKVPRTASGEEVKQAYRRLAREHHPDLHPERDKKMHTARMQEINEAYAVLGAKENRAKYDQLGDHWQEESPPPEPPRQDPGAYAHSEPDAEAFSDFFRNMFNRGEGRSAAEDLFPSELDIEAVLELSLEEAVKGVEKSFSLMTTGLCQNCRGTGRVKGALCPVCGGLGEIRKPREIKAKIPAGLTDGSRIRLKGQGNEGKKGRGDLYLDIRLKPDPRFKIDGLNLETELRIMPWQAALGSDVSVQTLDGTVKIRIPKMTHAGKLLRLGGKGLGKPDARGDFLIRIIIDIPDALSAKAEALMKQLEKESHA